MSRKKKFRCTTCGKDGYKTVSEYNRNKRKGRKNYCSLRCNGKANVSHLKKYEKQNTEVIKQHCGNRRDEYSPFKYHMRKVRARSKKKGWTTDLTVKYLKALWEQQQGVCTLSGQDLYLPPTSNAYAREKLAPNWASLDRIDSSLPYQQDNVRFISFIANMAKARFSDDQLLEFCKHVSNHNK